MPEAVALISLHADPLAALGRGSNGGMNLALRRLADHLSRLGVATEIWTCRSDPALPAEEAIADVASVIRLDLGQQHTGAGPEHDRLTGRFVQAVLDHPRGARHHRLVHGHYWLSGLAAQQLAQAWMVPWVQSFHSLASSRRLNGVSSAPEREVAEARMARAADRIVAMSRAEATALSAVYGADPGRICVVHPGADVSAEADDAAASRVRRELGLDHQRVVLYAGRLEPLKGTDTLLGVIRRLLSSPAHEDVTVLIAGDESVAGERRRLEDAVAEAGVASRVRFVGAVDHDRLAAHYRAADVCVMPSRAETFGLVAVEAGAAGTPVVVARVGGLTEIVEEGVNGYLVDPDDVDGFTERIGRLLSDAELRQRLGEAGRARAGTFTWARAAMRLASVYEGVEAGSTTPCPEL